MSEPAAPRLQLVRLDFRLGSSLSWVGPALAVIAGALASHGFGLDQASLLTLILALLLVDPLLGGLWHALVSTDWAGHWGDSASLAKQPLQFPHATTGSPAHRLSQWLARMLGCGAEQSQDGAAAPLCEAGFYLVVAIAVAAVLGAPVVLVVVAAFSMAIIRALLGGAGPDHRWLESVYAFAMPWLVGYGAFGGLPVDVRPASLIALALGAGMTLAYHGYRGLIAGGSVPGALLALNLGQVMAAFVLVIALRPWQAGLMGLLFVAQALWQPRLWRERDPGTYARETKGFLALAVLACFL